MNKKITLDNIPDYISEKSFQRLINYLYKIESETYPETESELHTGITIEAIKLILKDIDLPKESKILDIGCGKGPALKIFRENGYNPIGITLNDEDVMDCKEQGFEVYKMDQSFLNFEDNSFDLIWARHILEHSIFPIYTLQEMNRLIKSEGHIYIEVPAPNQIHKHEKNPNHYSVFEVKTWVNLFERTGFEVIIHTVIDLFLPEPPHNKVDAYFQFILKKKTENKTIDKEIYLALSKGQNFGWGVCSNYLKRELPKFHSKTKVWDFENEPDEITNVDGKVVHALTGLEFESISKLRGTENYGYTFFENELIDESVRNAKNYDLVIGGSTWCKDKMVEKGINNTAVLLQGIDPQIFYPIEKVKDDNLFVIFSGGKFELRKGQDLVMKAVKIMQEKYDDIILINAWYNMWLKTIKNMQISKHIKFEMSGNTWTELMHSLFQNNGIDVTKTMTFELIENIKLRELYAKTDIGLFPNRCEGGTNLVLMEYMACGKPVVGSYNSGHKDILDKSNSILLEEMKEFKLYNNDQLWADWEEPSLDEIVAKLEYAYHNRDEIRKIGIKAGQDLKKFTWAETAKTLYNLIK